MMWSISDAVNFRDHAKEWDKIHASFCEVPFLESAFLLPLLEIFGSGKEVIAFAHNGQSACAAGIFHQTRPGIWETFQPSQLPLGAWISSNDCSIDIACQALVRRLPGFCIALSITQQDPSLVSRPKSIKRINTLDYIDTAWIDIDTPFEHYWEHRGKNLKSNVRKQRSKLQLEGITTHLDCLNTPDQVAAAITDYGRLESTGWKGRDGTAVHVDNSQGLFYRKMLENFCQLGRGRIYRYRFGDKPVAMDLCIALGNKIVVLKTAYDESYKNVSPSTLMRQDTFQILFDEKSFEKIEFYGKVMDWHTRWTENKRTLFHLISYRWNWLAKIHALKLKSGKKSPVEIA